MNESEAVLLIYVAAGFFAGFIIHKWLMPLLANLAAKTKLKSDDLVIKVISKWVVSWLVALSIFLAV